MMKNDTQKTHRLCEGLKPEIEGVNATNVITIH
jgi:hypothetical protein